MTEAIHYQVNEGDLDVTYFPEQATYESVSLKWLTQYNKYASMLNLQELDLYDTQHPATDAQGQEPPTDGGVLNAVDATLDSNGLIPPDPTPPPTPPVQGPKTRFPQRMSETTYDGDPMAPKTCLPLVAFAPLFVAVAIGMRRRFF